MESEQSLRQKKITLAQSEHASVIIELMKDCMPSPTLVADNEWDTIVNAIRLDTQSTMMMKMTDYIEQIRQGLLHEPK